MNNTAYSILLTWLVREVWPSPYSPLPVKQPGGRHGSTCLVPRLAVTADEPRMRSDVVGDPSLLYCSLYIGIPINKALGPPYTGHVAVRSSAWRQESWRMAMHSAWDWLSESMAESCETRSTSRSVRQLAGCGPGPESMHPSASA
jgi:hypothetical protein